MRPAKVIVVNQDVKTSRGHLDQAAQFHLQAHRAVAVKHDKRRIRWVTVLAVMKANAVGKDEGTSRRMRGLQSPLFTTSGPAISEPQTYALMLAGLGLLALRRRRS
jgi:hypothetical protein